MRQYSRASRSRRAPRAAFRAFQIVYAARHNGTQPPPEHPIVLVAWCRCCALNTGNWCDNCERLGATFVNLQGSTFVGTPMCNPCAVDKDVKCPVCGSATLNEMFG